MERYEITQSLVSSWQYMFDCFEGYEEDAEAEFLSALRREKPVLDEKRQQAIDNGIEFENLVTDIAEGRFIPEFETDGTINKSSYGNGELMGYDKYPRWYDAAAKVAGIVRGGQFQVKAKKTVTVGGIEFLLYGRLDVLKAGTIYDVKFRNTSFQTGDVAGHYLNSPQHPFYFYLVPEAREFIYLVSDGDDLYTERYVPEDCESAESIISRFVNYLILTGRLEEYKAHWEVAA